jgi:hypothetical protein
MVIAARLLGPPISNEKNERGGTPITSNKNTENSMNSRLVKLALTFVSALSVGTALANPLTINADLHFENGATLGGSFNYDPVANTILTWDLTSFAFNISHEFTNTDASASAIILPLPGIGIANPDNDEVFSFGQNFNSPAPDNYTLSLVIGCGGVANCAGAAGVGMAFPLLGGQQTCTAIGPCASSGEGTFQALVPTQYLIGTSGGYFAVSDPPVGFSFNITDSIPEGYTLFDPTGGNGGSTTVPEPSSLALLAIGGLVSLLSKRRKAATAAA